MSNKSGHLDKLFSGARPKLAAIPGGPRVHVPTDMLGSRHFQIAIGIAVALHIVGIGIWQMLPRQEIVQVPVQTLNVKLGDGGALPADKLRTIAPGGINKPDLEQALSRVVRDPYADAARADSVTGAMERAMVELTQATSDQILQGHIAPTSDDEPITQYVREPQLQVTNSVPSAKDKAIVERYGSLISEWVQKFKVYPAAAKDKALSGETVVRIRIDRGGNIRYYILERSTGNSALDRAAIDMIRRANPVPAVPNDYPAGEQFEFLIPVEFQVQ